MLKFDPLKYVFNFVNSLPVRREEFVPGLVVGVGVEFVPGLVVGVGVEFVAGLVEGLGVDPVPVGH